MIRLPQFSELFRTINDIADGNAEAKGNTIASVRFMLVGEAKLREANSMWAATEWLRENKIAPHLIIWL